MQNIKLLFVDIGKQVNENKYLKNKKKEIYFLIDEFFNF